MGESRLSVTEYAVLGLLAEGDTHGFALSKKLTSEGEVGRVFTVRRPLVYRALDRLIESGYAEPVGTEKAAGPKRVVHRVTRSGRECLRRWLGEPVGHVRDLRIEFLLKLTLLERAGQSPVDLVRTQRRALKTTLAALDDSQGHTTDHVELWRKHNAIAAAEFLEDLELGLRRDKPQ
jgi:PadR family transcriptional regulator AphA